MSERSHLGCRWRIAQRGLNGGRETSGEAVSLSRQGGSDGLDMGMAVENWEFDSGQVKFEILTNI